MPSQDFGIDNEGSGFSFDADADFSKLYEDSASSAKDDAEDTSYLRYLDDDFHDKQKAEEVREKDKESEEIVIEDSQSEDTNISDDTPTYDDSNLVVDDTDKEYEDLEEFNIPEENNSYEETNNVVEEEKTEEPAPVKSSVVDRTQQKAESSYGNENTVSVSESKPVNRFNIPSEQDSIKEAQKIIKILDAYRSLENKNIVAQLICNESEVDPSDEARLVVKVLHADPMLGRMMKALREAASETDRVERVFYVLRLESDLAEYLGEFISTVNDVTFDNKHDKISFSKQLEQSINQLDRTIVQYVADAQSVLSSFEK